MAKSISVLGSLTEEYCVKNYYKNHQKTEKVK